LPLKGALNVYYRITCTATRKRVKRITPNAIQPFGAQLTGICFPAESLTLKPFFLGALQNELDEKQRIGQPERVGRFFILR